MLRIPSIYAFIFVSISLYSSHNRRNPSISELTTIIFNLELTYLGSDASDYKTDQFEHCNILEFSLRTLTSKFPA